MAIINHTSKVLEIQNLSEEVKHIVLSQPVDWEYEPGQFISVVIPTEDGRKLKKSYSICSTPGEKNIALCIKNVDGPGTKYFFSLKEGDEVEWIGAMGAFKLADLKDSVFIANGTGIGPFRSMIPVLLDAGKRVILLAGYRKDKLYNNEFEKLAENPNFSYFTVLSSEGGYVQDLLPEVKDFNGDYYICGLIEMIKDVGRKLSESGVPGERIKFERYD